MKIKIEGLILRVDDRLLHGQILIGWGMHGAIDDLYLISDRIRHNEKECRLYQSMIPASVQGAIWGLQESVTHLKTDAFHDRKILAVVEHCSDLKFIVKAGIIPGEIHLGALAHGENRSEISNCVALSTEDQNAIQCLQKEGIQVCLRQLPSDEPIPLKI
ncbi:PTS sugar transporter subunit IIB [bacterium]|nr:PTS sugar transporter subunit IIB [bacterium]